MRMHITLIASTLFICSLAAAAAASADTMAITYRSGKVQQVPMEEPSEEVAAISYLKASASQPGTGVKVLSTKQAGSEDGTRKEAVPETKKHGVTIKWAPPIDQ